MVYVTLAVLVSTALGIAAERRTSWAERVSKVSLGLILYVLLPYVSFVNFAHLHLSAGGGAGIVLGYLALAFGGVVSYQVAKRILRLPRASVGALVLCAVLVNTGYFGLPFVYAALGSKQLTNAVAYDQLVSSPLFPVIGFAIGAAFGAGEDAGLATRLRAFVTRNPPLLAVIAGLLTPASVVPNALVRASHAIVIALLPLGFFLVGVNLSTERREDRAPLLERPDARVLTGVALRELPAPLLLLAISATLIRLPHAYLVQAAMPTGINSLIIGHAYGLDQRLIATVIVWSTMLVLAVALLLGVA